MNEPIISNSNLRQLKEQNYKEDLRNTLIQNVTSSLLSNKLPMKERTKASLQYIIHVLTFCANYVNKEKIEINTELTNLIASKFPKSHNKQEGANELAKNLLIISAQYYNKNGINNLPWFGKYHNLTAGSKQILKSIYDDSGNTNFNNFDDDYKTFKINKKGIINSIKPAANFNDVFTIFFGEGNEYEELESNNITIITNNYDIPDEHNAPKFEYYKAHVQQKNNNDKKLEPKQPELNEYEYIKENINKEGLIINEYEYIHEIIETPIPPDNHSENNINNPNTS